MERASRLAFTHTMKASACSICISLFSFYDDLDLEIMETEIWTIQEMARLEIRGLNKC